jgi:hypothetical protein
MELKSGTLRSLYSHSLRVVKPITTQISQVQPNLFVAKAPDLHLLFFGEGSTRTSAVRSLAKGIECQYMLVGAIPRHRRSELDRAVLRSLRHFVRETNSTDDASPAREPAQSETRVQRVS